MTNTKNKKTSFKPTGNTLKTERTVYEQIADEFGKDIKIIKSLAGGTGTSAHINFRCYSRLAAQVTQMATKVTMFNSQSEVHRAAHYLGVQILFHLVMRDNFDFKCSQVYEAIQATEEMNYNYQILDDTARAFHEIYRSFAFGVVSQAERDKGTEDIVDSLPDRLKDLAIKASKRIFSGKPLREILHNKGVGHPGGPNQPRQIEHKK